MVVRKRSTHKLFAEREVHRLKDIPEKDMWKVAFEPECWESIAVWQDIRTGIADMHRYSRLIHVTGWPVRYGTGWTWAPTKVVPRSYSPFVFRMEYEGLFLIHRKLCPVNQNRLSIRTKKGEQIMCQNCSKELAKTYDPKSIFTVCRILTDSGRRGTAW